MANKPVQENYFVVPTGEARQKTPYGWGGFRTIASAQVRSLRPGSRALFSLSGRVCRYYVLLFAASMLAHAVLGHTRDVLMPRAFVLMFIGVLAALPWVAVNACNIISQGRRSSDVSELLTHCLFLFVIFAAAKSIASL